MDWFMLTAMVIAGWAVVSVFAGERMVRQHQVNAATAAAAAAKQSPAPPPPGKLAPSDVPTGPRLAA
jgi:hypothetical protein